MKRCRYPVGEAGERECGQPVYPPSDIDICSYHVKIVVGTIEPIDEVLAPEELEATMNGRPHGDGRRLDQYVTAD